MMSDNIDTHVICPHCHYPVPIIGPDDQLYDTCPLCDEDISEDIEHKKELIKELRVSVFLREFFDKPKLILPEELLEFLGISSKKILRKLVDKNHLDCVDVGAGTEKRVMRFRPVQILEFLEKRSSD